MGNVNGRQIPEDSPAQKIARITTNTVFAICRGLLCSVAVNADVTDGAGNVTTAVPLQAGYNPIAATKVVFASGDIIALY